MKQTQVQLADCKGDFTLYCNFYQKLMSGVFWLLRESSLSCYSAGNSSLQLLSAGADVKKTLTRCAESSPFFLYLLPLSLALLPLTFLFSPLGLIACTVTGLNITAPDAQAEGYYLHSAIRGQVCLHAENGYTSRQRDNLHHAVLSSRRTEHTDYL